MNLKQLNEIVKNTVDSIENQGPIKLMGTQDGPEHISVVIHLNEPSLGPSASVEITAASLGFDWDAGNFIIYPSEDIIRKSFCFKPGRKITEANNIYSCSSCACIVGKTDRFCKSCGKAL